MPRLDEFTQTYVYEALRETHYDENDIEDDTLDRIIAHCKDFQECCEVDLKGREALAGKGFWRGRNKLDNAFAEFTEEEKGLLMDDAKSYGEYVLELDDDGAIRGY